MNPPVQMIPPESPDARIVLTVAPTSTATPIQNVRVAPRRACSASSGACTGNDPNAVGWGNAAGAGYPGPGTAPAVGGPAIAGPAGQPAAGAVPGAGPSSGSQSCQPTGSGGRSARSGCQPGGGVQPAGGCGQDGGGVKRMVTSGGWLGPGGGPVHPVRGARGSLHRATAAGGGSAPVHPDGAAGAADGRLPPPHRDGPFRSAPGLHVSIGPVWSRGPAPSTRGARVAGGSGARRAGCPVCPRRAPRPTAPTTGSTPG